MSNWNAEWRLLRRHIGSGVVNTAVGVSAIVALTWLGVNPFLSNAIGYLVGLISGYLLSRFYTFESRGAVGREGLRYVVAFAVAYAVNLGTLHVCLSVFPAYPVAGQLVGAFAYTATMYLISRVFVFTPKTASALVNSNRSGT